MFFKQDLDLQTTCKGLRGTDVLIEDPLRGRVTISDKAWRIFCALSRRLAAAGKMSAHSTHEECLELLTASVMRATLYPHKRACDLKREVRAYGVTATRIKDDESGIRFLLLPAERLPNGHVIIQAYTGPTDEERARSKK